MVFVICAGEEVEVSFHVLILDLKLRQILPSFINNLFVVNRPVVQFDFFNTVSNAFWLFKGLEQLDSLIDTVLQLKIVHEDELIGETEFFLVEHACKEAIVGLSEGFVQYAFSSFLTNGVCT